ncbi:MAG: choice-of-anchor J domain-containing protein [Candidatus Cloacimonetes bacterium]|nr:choice-of-anchor J domain-containing protein [Candidatus Cloacimonadota bacterium]
MKKLIFLFALLAILAPVLAQTYLFENFETAFVGTPAAPPEWTQTMNRPVNTGASERDWARSVYSGSGTTWAPASSGTNPAGAVSGTGALWIDDYNFGGSGDKRTSRRMESPALDLLSASSAYLRFWYFNAQGIGTNLNLRVMASRDGGASWDNLTPIVNGFTGTANTWNRISVAIPSYYYTANAKIGFELTGIWGSHNPFIDDVSVEEFTPTWILSAGSGEWNSGATWVGGVVPTADNHVEILAGHTVNITNTTGIIARCQRLNLSGTLTHGSGTTNMLHAYSHISISNTGTLNAFQLGSTTSGRTVYCGGNFSIAAGGSANFSVGITMQSVGTTTSTSASQLVVLGFDNTVFTNSGTLVNGRINNFAIMKPYNFDLLSPVTVPYTLGLHSGNLSHSGNLTLGNALNTSDIVQTIVCHGPGLGGVDPVWNNTRIASRNYTFYSPPWVPFTRTNVWSNSVHFELVGGVRTVTGTLTMNTHNNLLLTSPLTVGTATTGSMTLTRGIIITDDTNLLHLAQGNTSSSSGLDPSTATPPTTHGSYVAGPLRRTYPASGSTTREFPLGIGYAFNGETPNANVRKQVTIATGATGASGQSPTVSVAATPTGTVNLPATQFCGIRAYRVNLNGGPDFPASATITMRGLNRTWGNSDQLFGMQNQLHVLQSTAINGTWNVRSPASGTAVGFVNDTAYARTTTTSVEGPIAPLAALGEYFAWGTSAPTDPVFGYSPTSIDFGLVSQGVPTAWTNVTITNTGGGTLTLLSSDVSLTGTDPDQFEWSNANFPMSLTPASPSATIPVRMLATSEGAKSATLNINYSGTDYPVTLSGTGLPEGTVVIGSGLATQRQPMGVYWGYERSAALYTNAQLQALDGRLNQVGWYCATPYATVVPYRIYAKQTTATAFTAQTWADFIVGATLVKEGTYAFSTVGWHYFNTDNIFIYTGDNLIIVVETFYGGTGTSSYPLFRYSTGTAGSHQFWYADNTPPVGAGTLNTQLPNIIVQFTEPPAGPPDPPILISPIGGAVVPKNGFNLQWTPAGTGGFPDSYVVYVADTDVEEEGGLYEQNIFPGILTTTFNPVTQGGMTFNYDERWYWTVEAVVTGPPTVTAVAAPEEFLIESDPRLPLPYEQLFPTSDWPTGWTQTFSGGVTSNRWNVNNTNNAGGTAYEMRAGWVSGTGISRLISPPLLTEGLTQIKVDFASFYDDYGPGVTARVMTSNDLSTWTPTTWSIVSGSGNVGPGLISINIPVTGATTYVAWVFDGDHYQFDYWYIDNVVIYVPVNDDVGVQSILGVPTSQLLNATYNPQAVVVNNGLGTQTFDVTLTMGARYSSTVQVTDLAGGNSTTVNFDPWIPGTLGDFNATVVAVNPGDEDLSDNTMVQPFTVYETIWTIEANHPLAGSYLGSAAGYIDGTGHGIIITSGGNTALYTEVMKYNTNTNTWSALTNIPDQRRVHASVVVDGYLYVIGGSDDVSVYYNTLYRYDIAGDLWTTLAPIPVNNAWGKAAAWNDTHIYLAGGHDGTNYLNTVYVYDIGANSWAVASPMPEARIGGAFAITGNTLVYTAGADAALVRNTVYVGEINPLIPGSISWSTSRNTYPGVGTASQSESGDPAALEVSHNKDYYRVTAYPAGTMFRFDGATWGDDAIIVAGGSPSTDWTPADPSKAYYYTPADDTWHALPDLNVPVTAAYFSAVQSSPGTWKAVASCGLTNGSVTGNWTQVLTVVMGAIEPDTPTNVIISTGPAPGQVQITWDNMLNADWYGVYGGTDPENLVYLGYVTGNVYIFDTGDMGFFQITAGAGVPVPPELP